MDVAARSALEKSTNLVEPCRARCGGHRRVDHGPEHVWTDPRTVAGRHVARMVGRGASLPHAGVRPHLVPAGTARHEGWHRIPARGEREGHPRDGGEASLIRRQPRGCRDQTDGLALNTAESFDVFGIYQIGQLPDRRGLNHGICWALIGGTTVSQTSPTLRRETSGDGSPRAAPQSDRLAALEAAVAAIQQALDVQLTRMGQMQAQIDLLVARDRNI